MNTPTMNDPSDEQATPAGGSQASSDRASGAAEAKPRVLETPDHVLSTLEKDGSRRWLKPKLSKGKMLFRRRIVAYILIAIFTLLPYIKYGGKPFVLLDIPSREFTIFFYTFLPTDTVLLALFMVGLLLSVFLATALVGRVWCGWACPQTVYMEFLYRPIERFFDGTSGRGGRAKKGIAGWRKAAMYATYLVVSMFLAHTFLAYFVGVDNLVRWVQQSPIKHPVPFFVMAFVTGAMMFDFCFFREQLCLIACPYGRFQSVLLDRNSLIVAYDTKRGEPRGKARGKQLPVIDGVGSEKRSSDCVDCHLCVTTCPTGIDIRDGLQMECINCTQCIDACDAVMTKLKRPTGLIRYASQTSIDREKRSVIRPRVIVYPLILLAIGSLFTFLLLSKKSFDAVLLRNVGSPFTVTDEGLIQNVMRIKITNRGEETQTYSIESLHPEASATVVDGAKELAPGGSITLSIIVRAPFSELTSGKLPMDIKVSNNEGDSRELEFRFLGPYQDPAKKKPSATTDATLAEDE